jgi:hypothetical protein
MDCGRPGLLPGASGRDERRKVTYLVTEATETEKVRATSVLGRPATTARAIRSRRSSE